MQKYLNILITKIFHPGPEPHQVRPRGQPGLPHDGVQGGGGQEGEQGRHLVRELAVKEIDLLVSAVIMNNQRT